MREDTTGALLPGKLGLNCKANKCSDAGHGDLGVLITHEILSMETAIMLSLVMPAKPAPDEGKRWMAG